MQCIWSFFESGHGKGDHDGAGACVKRALRRYQLCRDSQRFRDARQVVDWCTHHMGVDSSSSLSTVGARVVRRFFWYVDGADIDVSSGDCATVHGTLYNCIPFAVLLCGTPLSSHIVTHAFVVLVFILIGRIVRW